MLESRVAASDLGIVLSQQNQIKRLRGASRASPRSKQGSKRPSLSTVVCFEKNNLEISRFVLKKKIKPGNHEGFSLFLFGKNEVSLEASKEASGPR